MWLSHPRHFLPFKESISPLILGNLLDTFPKIFINRKHFQIAAEWLNKDYLQTYKKIIRYKSYLSRYIQELAVSPHIINSYKKSYLIAKFKPAALRDLWNFAKQRPVFFLIQSLFVLLPWPCLHCCEIKKMHKSREVGRPPILCN